MHPREAKSCHAVKHDSSLRTLFWLAARRHAVALSRRTEGEKLREVEAGGKNGRRGAAGGEL
jgi:hypothetical protein